MLIFAPHANMKHSRRKAARRIAAVTLLMAGCASPVAWLVSRENAEQQVVAFAQEESRRVIAGQESLRLDGPNAAAKAEQAAQLLTGGLFEIAEIYSAAGDKLAESVTAAGEPLEAQLPPHGKPSYTRASYESLQLPSDQWVLRVFVPLRELADGPITGYFEGVRLIPAWQHAQILSDAFIVALMVCLASLVCGAAIYPVVVRLAARRAWSALRPAGARCLYAPGTGPARATGGPGRRERETADERHGAPPLRYAAMTRALRPICI